MARVARRPKPVAPKVKPPVPQNTKVTTRTITVTPEMATKWLEKNVNNRRLNKPLEDRQVQAYARDMKAGHWRLTGEPIIFDWNGDLLNGQHRLWACIFADAPFQTVVTYGVDPESRIVIDTGRKRTLGNYLSMPGQGEKDASALAAVINLCFRWDHDAIGGDGSLIGNAMVVNHEDAVEWLTENNEVRQSVLVGSKFYREMRFGKTQAAAAHYLNARVNAEAADDFWHKATTGVDLPDGSAILALRRYVQNQHVQKHMVPGPLVLVYFLKAMGLWQQDKSVRLLQVREGENIGTWER